MRVFLASTWLTLFSSVALAQTSASCAAQDATLDRYDGPARCVCHEAYALVWTPEGCLPCPPFEMPGYDNEAEVWSCYCAWPAVEIDGKCECPMGTYKDFFTNKCASCGSGTDPSALGCSCADPTMILDLNNNCVPGRGRSRIELHVQGNR